MTQQLQRITAELRQNGVLQWTVGLPLDKNFSLLLDIVDPAIIESKGIDSTLIVTDHFAGRTQTAELNFKDGDLCYVTWTWGQFLYPLADGARIENEYRMSHRFTNRYVLLDGTGFVHGAIYGFSEHCPYKGSAFCYGVGYGRALVRLTDGRLADFYTELVVDVGEAVEA